VNVTLIVTPSAAGAGGSGVSTNAAPKKAKPLAGGGCSPSSLAATQTGLVNNFSTPVAWPTPLVIVLADNCGSLVPNGQIGATFSNGDPALGLPLVNSAQGLYSATWTPRKALPQMTISVRASANGFPDATTVLQGTSVPNAAPILTPHSTLHVFDPLVGSALA